MTKTTLRVAVAAALTFAIAGPASAGSDVYIGEIDTFPYNFCPRGYAPMNGQLISISQNTALFSLLGTTYGGNGTTNFALPAAKPIITMSGAPLVQCISLQGIFPTRN